jgi:hypothetical protein
MKQWANLLWYELRSPQIGIADAKNEKLRIGPWAGEILLEVIVIREPERVQLLSLIYHVRAKRNSLQFGRNLIRREAICRQHVDYVQKERLAYGGCRNNGLNRRRGPGAAHV